MTKMVESFPPTCVFLINDTCLPIPAARLMTNITMEYCPTNRYLTLEKEKRSGFISFSVFRNIVEEMLSSTGKSEIMTISTKKPQLNIKTSQGLRADSE